MTLNRPPSHTIVIFGASGDLTNRKVMPAIYNLFAQELMPKNFVVIGYSRSDLTDEQFRSRVKDSIKQFSRTGLDESVFNKLAPMLHYISGEFSNEGAMQHLEAALQKYDNRFGSGDRRLFYCATPPVAFPQIAKRLGEESLAADSRIVIEKPFGRDSKSALELNEVLHEVFVENQIFRIDHYLGKETVQNILVFRFANGMFEPIWNRRYVAALQIDVAEDIGISGRGKFYDGAGAIRDISQNHLLQLLAILTMEPPASFEAEALRDEKVKLLRSIPPVDPSNVVRGQYTSGSVGGKEVPGYREEPDIPPGSTTETYVAMKLSIENWRWAGVPIFIRTGKRLPRRTTEATVMFYDAPHMLFRQAGSENPYPNHLSIRIQPNEGISLTFDAKVPGPEMEVAPVKMDFDYEDSFMTAPAEAYERLLLDVMEGDSTLFTRADEIERAWEIVEPAISDSPPDPYWAGSWGPARADQLIAPAHWHLH